MLKTSSKAKLWQIATNDIFFGNANALVLANRMKDSEGSEIVSRVYSVSAIQENPFLSKECEFCGCEFIAEEENQVLCSEDCANAYYGY